MEASKSYNQRVETRSETFSTPSMAAPAKYGGENSECCADPMVTFELEAAEALAGLADSVTHENENLCSKTAWNAVKPTMPEFSDLAEDRGGVVRQPCRKICNVMKATTSNASCGGSKSYASGSKSRQDFTENEKDAKRMHRVLANRVSARQAIRRKQVFYEELSRKAVDLAWENDNLKRKRESIMKDFDALKSTNEFLKAQMAKTMKTELDETQNVPTHIPQASQTHVALTNRARENSPTHAQDDISTRSSTHRPFFIYNQPSFMPFLWSSIINSPDSSQNVIRISATPNLFNEQENPSTINGTGTPLYMLPYGWFFNPWYNGNKLHTQSFFPPLYNGNRLYPPSFFPPLYNGNGLYSQSFSNISQQYGSSSKTTTDVGNNHSIPKVSSLLYPPANGVPETTFGFLTDGVSPYIEVSPYIDPCRKGMFFMSPPVTSIRPPTTVRGKNDLPSDYLMDGHTVNALSEINQQLVEYHVKKLFDLSATIGARKRRKQLVKLKNVRSRRSDTKQPAKLKNDTSLF